MSEKNIMNGLVGFSFVMVLIFIGLLSWAGKGDTEGVDEDGTTHLMSMTLANEYTGVNELLSRGAKVNARNKAGWTPIMYAAKDANASMIHLLTSNGAEVNNPQDSPTSPLHLAIDAEKPFIERLTAMEVLLKNGADVGFIDEDGVTPIMTATRRDSREVEEIVGALKKHGADINGVSKGYTPLSYAIYIAEDDISAVGTALVLINAGADPNISTGVTALMATVMRGFPTTARLLIERGAEKGLVNTDNATPLDIAVLYEKKELIELLTR